MTRRSLAILAAVSLLLIVATFLLPGYGGDSVERAKASGPVFKDLAQSIASVDRLTVTAGGSGGGNATLERKGDHWTLAEKGDYQADPAKVNAVLAGLAQLNYVEAKTADPQLLPRLDLSTNADGKGRRIDAKAGEKYLAVLVAGKKRQGTLSANQDGIYFRVGDAPQAWLGQPAFDLPTEQTAWLDRSVPGMDPAAVKQVVITQPDKASLTVSRPAADQPFAIAALPANTVPKSQTGLAELASAAAGFDFQDVMPAAVFQFPATGAVTADVTGFDGLVLRFEMVDRNGGTWARITASGTADKADPLKPRLAGWVFLLPAARATSLKSKLADITEAKPS